MLREMEILHPLNEAGKKKDPQDKSLITAYRQNCFNERIDQDDYDYIAEISPHEENILYLCGDQDFGEKQDNGNQKVGAAELYFHDLKAISRNLYLKHLRCGRFYISYFYSPGAVMHVLYRVYYTGKIKHKPTRSKQKDPSSQDFFRICRFFPVSPADFADKMDDYSRFISFRKIIGFDKNSRGKAFHKRQHRYVSFYPIRKYSFFFRLPAGKSSILTLIFIVPQNIFLFLAHN